MQSYSCKPLSFPTAEVTVSFNPTSYTINEGERVDFLLELTGEAQASVVVMFETSDGSAIDTYTFQLQLSHFNFMQLADVYTGGAGADLGLLQWWGCSINAREACEISWATPT